VKSNPIAVLQFRQRELSKVTRRSHTGQANASMRDPTLATAAPVLAGGAELRARPRHARAGACARRSGLRGREEQQSQRHENGGRHQKDDQRDRQHAPGVMQPR